MSVLNSLIGSAGAVLQIFETDLSRDTSLADWIEPDDNAIWLDYMVTNHYEHDFHRYMMGITSPNGFQGKSAAFVQLASPTMLWVCEWTALKIGNQPEVPDPNAVGSEWILLDVHPELPMENVASDGDTPLYRVSGVYVYGHTNPNLSTFVNTSFPHPPFLTTDGFVRKLSPSKLTTGISSDETTGSSSTGAGTVPFIPPSLKG